MADDLSRNGDGSTVRIMGNDLDGNETNPVGASENQEVWIRDTHDNGGLDAILELTTTPTEGKVGATVKLGRKYLVIEALTTNVKWGFSSTSQSFDLFKSQLIMVPLGENTQIWFSMASGTGRVAFGELS